MKIVVNNKVRKQRNELFLTPNKIAQKFEVINDDDKTISQETELEVNDDDKTISQDIDNEEIKKESLNE